MAQANGIFFALSASADLPHSWEQEVSSIDDTLIFAVLAHIEEFQLHGVVRDECGELRPFQQSDLALAVQVIAPLGSYAHLVELFNSLGVGYAAEGRFDRLQHGHIGS